MPPCSERFVIAIAETNVIISAIPTVSLFVNKNSLIPKWNPAHIFPRFSDIQYAA